MIPLLYEVLSRPLWISVAGWIFVLSHYVLSYAFNIHSKRRASANAFSRNGPLDVVTSVVWGFIATFLILSLIDLIYRQAVTIPFLIQSYVLLIFLFAYLYNVIEWHYPGTFRGARSGFELHVQCLILSAEAFSGGASERLSTKSLKIIAILTLQRLLGLLFVAVFIAKAVGMGSK
jgi:hypothetical protein